MRTDWYRQTFPRARIDKAKDTESEVRTMERGYRLATSVGGTLTGRGGDIIIIDDPIKPQDAQSKSVREKTGRPVRKILATSRGKIHLRWPSGKPRLNAFCRSALAVRFMALAIFLTGDLLRECAFSSRTSAFDQRRSLGRLLRLPTITHL
jgi:hypothetical protein